MSNLDTEHRFIPEPLDGDAYLNNAVEAPTDSEGELAVVSVDRGAETAALGEYLKEKIDSGEIDMNELLGIGS